MNATMQGPEYARKKAVISGRIRARAQAVEEDAAATSLCKTHMLAMRDIAEAMELDSEYLGNGLGQAISEKVVAAMAGSSAVSAGRDGVTRARCRRVDVGFVPPRFRLEGYGWSDVAILLSICFLAYLIFAGKVYVRFGGGGPGAHPPRQQVDAVATGGATQPSPSP